MSYKRDKFGRHKLTDECDLDFMCTRCKEDVCPCRKAIVRIEGDMCQECSDKLDVELYDKSLPLHAGKIIDESIAMVEKAEKRISADIRAGIES